MADRFFSEGSDRSGYAPDKTPKSPYGKTGRGGPGDFVENISSGATSRPTPSTARKSSKFEVHIDDFESVMPSDASARTGTKPASSAGQRPVTQGASSGRKTSPQPTANRRSAPANTARRPASGRPAAGAKADRTATGRTAPVANGRKAPAAARSKKRKKQRYDTVKGLLIACVCTIFITIITVGASTVAFSLINDVFVIDKDQNRTVTVEIPKDADYDEVFEILNENGLIRQPFLTDIFCKFRHYDEVDVKDSETGEIVTKRIQYEPGIYYLEKNSGIEKLLETIMVKKNVSKDTVRLTFPEGWSIAQIFEKIEKYKVCTAEKLYANLEIIGEQYSFISDITPDADRYLVAEGYLFPDTYDFYIDESPSSVLKKLFNNFDAKWTEEFDDRAKELGLTVDQVINLAAMIQREAKDSSQMAVISSVMHNRLADSNTYPYFEMNSTKDYISSLKEYNLFSDFYYEMYLTSYNTYSEPGLPPGPICNPGLSAIKAALYPSDTNYYFFCHDSSGEIYLAQTADEHKANTEKVIYGNY